MESYASLEFYDLRSASNMRFLIICFAYIDCIYVTVHVKTNHKSTTCFFYNRRANRLPSVDCVFDNYILQGSTVYGLDPLEILSPADNHRAHAVMALDTDPTARSSQAFLKR